MIKKRLVSPNEMQHRKSLSSTPQAYYQDDIGNVQVNMINANTLPGKSNSVVNGVLLMRAPGGA